MIRLTAEIPVITTSKNGQTGRYAILTATHHGVFRPIQTCHPRVFPLNYEQVQQSMSRYLRPLMNRKRTPAVTLILLASLLLAGCASLPLPILKAQEPASIVVQTRDADEEFSELLATMRSDLTRMKERIAAATPAAPKVVQPRVDPAGMTAQLPAARRSFELTLLPIPVVGVHTYDLEDSWGDSRDGGRRRHRGIDIFAPRGRSVVAVADGTITYIGEQPKAGRCIWLSTEDGVAFFYAHLDTWSAGMYEGMEVRKGQVLGTVGNTGNARRTPSHLHFAVHRDDDAVDPYPLLTKGGLLIRNEEPVLTGGFGRGSSQ